MKIFSLFDLLAKDPARTLRERFDDCAAWLRDPLSHPAIEHMSQRELADLPFRMTAGPTPTENCRPA